MSAPKEAATTVVKKPTNEQMERATERFLSPKGALKKFADAGLTLRSLVEMSLYTPEYKTFLAEEKRRGVKEMLLGIPVGAPLPVPTNIYATAAAYPDITLEQQHDLLIEHTGLSGEFGNGIKMAWSTLAYDRADPGKLVAGLKYITELLEYPSQLTSTSKDVAEKIGITKEMNREALGRVADQIEQWMNVNLEAGKITPHAAFMIEDAIELYRAGLKDVLKFADKAKAFSNTEITSPKKEISK